MTTLTIKRIAVTVSMLAVVLASAATAAAQTGGGYDLTWNTADGGGVTFATGGNYSLGATVGQADAGQSSGGSYTLNGGFWYDPFVRVYVPSTARGFSSGW